MKRAIVFAVTLLTISCLFAGGGRLAVAQLDFADDNPREGVEELTRGPVHEAFANPLAEEEKRFVIPRVPPEPILEEPAELRPEGDNIVWIPGYWAWDGDREDFIWVSGVWRHAPPNQRWTPGYWIEAEGGWVWVSGFWTPTETEEFRYYPPPPETLEAGPSSPSPGDDHFWVTGNWIYRDDDFRWQAGHWSRLQPDWVWVPPNWVWTPAGYVFLPGRWDYPWARRGCLYTPVYFAANVYSQPGFVYRPRLSINLSTTLVHLWVRPNHRHYYFGDYYAPRYRDQGFASWATYASGPRHYDPLLTYYQTRYRRDGIDYADRMRNWHDHYVRRENERPPATWHDQAAWARRQNLNFNDLTGKNSAASSLLAMPSRAQAELLKRTDSSVRFTEVSRTERERATEVARNFRTLNTQRAEFEHQARSTSNLGAAVRPERPGNDRNDDDRSRNRAAVGDVRWQLPKAALTTPHVVGREPTNALPGRGERAREQARTDEPRNPDRTPRSSLPDDRRPLPGDTSRGDGRDDVSGTGRRDRNKDDARTLPDRNPNAPATQPGDKRFDDPIRTPTRRPGDNIPNPNAIPGAQPGDKRFDDPIRTPTRPPGDNTPNPNAIPGAQPGDKRFDDPIRTPTRRPGEDIPIRPADRNPSLPPSTGRRPGEDIPIRPADRIPQLDPNRRPDTTPRNPTVDRRVEEALRNVPKRNDEPRGLPKQEAAPRNERRPDAAPMTPRIQDRRPDDAIPQLQRKPEVRTETPKALPELRKTPEPQRQPQIRPEQPRPSVEQRRPEPKPEVKPDRGRPMPMPEVRNQGRGNDSGPKNADRGRGPDKDKDKEDKRKPKN